MSLYKRILFPAVLALIALGLMGCGDSTSSAVDTSQTQTAISNAVSGFKTAVESYNVTNMLLNMDTANFSLVIQENGITDANGSAGKNYATLQSELRGASDIEMTNQLAWRQAYDNGVHPNYHGYKLILGLGSLTYSNLSDSGGYGQQNFTVTESAVNPPISATQTDSGTITWQVVKDSGSWYIRGMTINYTTGIALSFKNKSGTSTSGFGFTTLNAQF